MAASDAAGQRRVMKTLGFVMVTYCPLKLLVII
jgi:hypothetical protein